jgi:hypothetical protein
MKKISAFFAVLFIFSTFTVSTAFAQGWGDDDSADQRKKLDKKLDKKKEKSEDDEDEGDDKKEKKNKRPMPNKKDW